MPDTVAEPPGSDPLAAAPTAPRWTGRLLVRGTGLIGTSLALAAGAAGAQVSVDDPDEERLALAVSLGAGRRLDDAAPDEVDLVVIAAPPGLVGALAASELDRPGRHVVSHVCSVQVQPQREVEAAGADVRRFLGSHPVAGREVSGPAHASAELFRDRPWILCPTDATDPNATDTMRSLARACGARPVVLDPARHDALLARLSHLPQLAASALAAALADLPADEVALAGTGLRDTTRVADSDPGLWAEIAAGNREPVAAELTAIAEVLVTVAASLRAGADEGAAAVQELLERGRAGRGLLPGKHGGPPRFRSQVQVAVPDSPGALAALLAAVAGEQVNLEDLRVEHAPGQPTGVALMAVDPGAADRLIAALRERGWTVAAGPTTAI